MRKIYFYILLLVSPECFCNDMDRAVRHIQRAVARTETVQEISKNTERKLKKAIPESIQSTLVFVGAVGSTAMSGRINTRDMTRMEMRFLGGVMRSDIEYNFRENVVGLNVTYQMDF
jgi:putative NADH-flavin reductase